MENVGATQEQVRPGKNMGTNRFQEPQGSASSLQEGAWMFDNEIDWVTHQKGDLSVVRRISGV